MKRGKIVTFVCIVFLLLVCFVWSYFYGHLPELLPHSVSYFKFLRGMSAFLKIFPAVLCTAFLVDFSVFFGRNDENSTQRFSAQMFVHYKKIVVTSLFYVFMMSMATLVFLPKVSRAIAYVQRQPDLFAMYFAMAKENKEQGRDLLAYRLMHLAAQINPNSAEVQTLKTKYEIESEHIVDSEALVEIPVEKIPFDEEISSSANCLELLQKAKKAFSEERWLDAHYYASMAVRIANPRDISRSDAEKTAAEAWRKISEIKYSGDFELASVFNRKMEGYNAYIRADYLESYYIFNELKILQRNPDPDVKRYLELSRKNLEKQYFFFDECEDLQRYETVSNLYFVIKHEDKSCEVYFAKGVTDLKKQGNLVRFLRDFSVTYFDGSGTFVKQLSVPYAKMLSVDSSFFNRSQREKWSLDNSETLQGVKYVPYILLSSVNRESNVGISKPAYKYATGREADAEECSYLVVPMNFADFGKIAEASNGAENMDLFSLMSFVRIASKYGYSTEVFNMILQEKILYPLSLLLLLLLFANMAWNYRISGNSLFKFKWTLFIPFFVPLVILFMQTTFFVIRQLCLVITYHAGAEFSLLLAISVEILFLVMLSVLFLSRKE